MPIIEGEIFLQVKGLLRTQKTKKYGVLYGKSADSHPFMELFDSEEDFDNKRDGKKCESKKIDLHHIKAITNQTQSTSKGAEYHMEIRTKKEKTNLFFDCEEEFKSWSSNLNGLVNSSVNSSDKTEENSISSLMDTGDSDDDDDCVTLNEMYGGVGDVERFEVTVDGTALAKLCNIEGKHTLLVSETSLAFENIKTKKIGYSFQFQWMRRFGKKEAIFSFELGRKCPNGAGEIKCNTVSAKYIHDFIRQKSKSRGTTVTPAPMKGISAAQHAVKQAIERPEPKNQDTRISGPAVHMQKRHPGLGTGPKLIPLNVTKDINSEDENTSPVPSKDSSKRASAKSLNGESTTGKSGGSVKHGHMSGSFAKQLENAITDPHHKDSVKIKDKDRDSKKKEKEEKENKKKEKERKEKERKEEKEKERKEEKKQKEKYKKEEKKGKEKVQAPPIPAPRALGSYEEVDIINPTPSSPSTRARNQQHSNYSEATIEDDDLYDQATPPTTKDAPCEYAQPVTRKTKPVVQCEYADVKIVGNAWKSQGRSEEEEKHEEDYIKIKSLRDQLASGPPPIPDKRYTEDDEDDTYNRLDLKASKPRVSKPKSSQKSDNIYGTASGTKVGPIEKNVLVPESGNDESDSGESLIEEDTYATPDFEDTYDTATDIIKPKKTVDSYEEAKPPVKASPRRVHEEALYDEVT